MYSRLLKPPSHKKSFFLFGPRGSGKTAWLKQTFPEALYFDLLESRTYLDFKAQPERLERIIPDGFQEWVIIDEIQRIPELLNEVHRLIESKKLAFILTGSSARSLRKKGVNLLAGRALMYKMHPLTVLELGKDFSLKHALLYGHLPATFSESDPQKYLEAYVATYIREEVVQEGLTRNIGNFTRFLEAASFSQGSVLNMSEVAREAKIERKVVESYFQILEDLLLGNRLSVFSKRAKRRLMEHSKFYFFDAGVFRTIRPTGPFDKTEELEGALLETLLYQELRALNDYLELGYTLYYWRTSSQLEVDFVLYGKRGILAFEIKRSSTLHPKDLNGLRAFKEDYPEAKRYLFYAGTRREVLEDIEVIPLEEAFKLLPKLL